MSMLEKYIINRLENVEAENEDLRATNKLLSDKLARLTGEGTMVVRPEHGTYYWTAGGKVWQLGYDYTLTVDGRLYVASFDDGASVTHIDDDTYFLSKEEAIKKAKADQS